MKPFYTNVQSIGNYILYRGIDADGQPIQFRVPYRPTLFVSSNVPTDFKTLDGKFVAPINPGSIQDSKDFVRGYEHVENFDIYGNTNYHYSYITEEYPNDIEYDKSKLSIVNIDIETDSTYRFAEPESATEKVTAITIKHNDLFWVFGCKPYETKSSNIKYIECVDEEDLLSRFTSLWRELNPDIITGWNVQFYDIPYLYNRILNLFGEKAAKTLSPWKKISWRTAIIHGKETPAITLQGICILDYIELYKKFTYNLQESYRLDHIAYMELGERKISYSEYSSLHELYNEDFQKFIDYNIHDVELVERLDQKMQFIDMVLALAYSAKVNYNDVFSQVRMWDTMIYNYLASKNIVLPPKPTAHSKNHQYTGAYVKDPIVGMHHWVVSFDLNSLYPHLIMQYNISPETRVPRNFVSDEVLENLRGVYRIEDIIAQKFDTSILKKHSLTVTPNDEYFRTDVRGFLPEMMEHLYEERKLYKKKMIEAEKKLQQCLPDQKRALENEVAKYKNVQLARKVQLNSAYGALGNPYFRFYDIRQAEAVTKSGQLSIRWIETRINQYLNTLLSTEEVDYVIASDTDSIYVTLDGLVSRVFPNGAPTEKIVNFLDKVSDDKFQSFINTQYRELAAYVNAYDQKMFMAREVIADKGVWTAKKRYILNVYDSEGVRYATPKIKMMGIEAVKSSTPEVCRSKIKEAMTIMMNGTENEVIAFIEDFRKEFVKLDPEDIGFPRGINGIDKYYDGLTIFKKGTPIHVKGALLYNSLLKKHKLGSRYPEIRNGDKIKYLHLIEPNPTQNSVITILDDLPAAFNLNNYIDKDTQFEKAFIAPLQIIFDKIGWNTKETFTLENFFG